jgi:hypothetical protein
MTTSELPCPFCSKGLSNRAGLASHIRSAHPKKYAKWKNQSQTRTKTEAATPAFSGQVADAPNPTPIGHSKAREKAVIDSRNPTVSLLNEAYAQLQERKKSVEGEFHRIDSLRKELETINAQIESLELTLGVFATETSTGSA